MALTAWGIRGLGLATGAVLALGLASTVAVPSGPQVVSDVDGPLRHLVIHIGSDHAVSARPTYEHFLASISKEITVTALCADDKAMAVAKDLSKIHPVRAIAVNHPMTSWSKDRWLALEQEGRTSLLVPRHEDGSAAWPLRAGDAQAARDLEGADPSLRAIMSAWDFDGGDVVADDQFAFVASAVVKKNLGRLGSTYRVLGERLSARLGLPALMFEGAPDHHAGMYCMVAGDGRLVVGDPSMAKSIRPHGPNLTRAGDDYSPDIQQQFDAVAKQALGLGYQVTRIPVVPEHQGRGWLSWCNVIIDERRGRRIVYLPLFSDAPVLQSKAQDIWETLGFEVVPIPCDEVRHLGGTLRCLVSTLERGPSTLTNP